jgi:EmrB/QacA subfamily drug resistance transporter
VNDIVHPATERPAGIQGAMLPATATAPDLQTSPDRHASPDQHTSHVATAPAGQLRTVMAGALLAMVLAALDQNIVNTALPRMAGDLGGMGHLSWVVTAFMLTATTTTPIYGKLSDIYGRRMLFFVAILIFLGGSLLCGAAQSMGQIIAFRAIQGLGAGGLLVLAQAAIGDVVSPRDRPRYQGLFTGTFALASVAGPLLGGLITSALSWRWVFYVNLPVGALALTMIAIGLRKPPSGKARPIDYAGALLLAGATAALLLLLAWGGTEFPWASADSVGLVAATAALIGLFIWREGRAPEPLIRLPLFRNAVFARGVAVGGMMTFAMLGSTVFLPLYFQLVLGMDPAVAGAMMLPQVVGMLLSSVIGGRIVTKLGRNKPFLLAGLGLEAVALGSLAAFAFIGAPPTIFLISMAALGLGMGMGMPNLTTAVQNAVVHRELGAATGAMSFVRSLGGALGVAASGTIMSTRLATAISSAGLDMRELNAHRMQTLAHFTPAQHEAVATAYRTALTGCFLLSGTVMTIAFLLVLGLPEITLRSEIDDAATA